MVLIFVKIQSMHHKQLCGELRLVLIDVSYILSKRRNINFILGYSSLDEFQGLPHLGEIYPLGGSADRLGFVDPDTGECLPAAMLPYCGRTLLEGLIRDLQV